MGLGRAITAARPRRLGSPQLNRVSNHAPVLAIAAWVWRVAIGIGVGYPVGRLVPHPVNDPWLWGGKDG